MSGKDQLIAWLNDAYAMEQGLEETLERHADDAKDDPKVYDRITRHVEETRDQARIVQECVEALGGKISKTKSMLASATGAVQGMMNRPAGDTMVKNALADYAAECYEIACYKALIQAATEIGEDAVVQRLAGILRQEQDMAKFLEQQLPTAVSKTLADASAR